MRQGAQVMFIQKVYANQHQLMSATRVSNKRNLVLFWFIYVPLILIEPRSPTLLTVSLPSESSEKPKNTGVCSPSVLQGVFLTQESNWDLLHYRRIFYQLSYQGSFKKKGIMRKQWLQVRCLFLKEPKPRLGKVPAHNRCSTNVCWTNDPMNEWNLIKNVRFSLCHILMSL